jgi:hypothetical protein
LKSHSTGARGAKSPKDFPSIQVLSILWPFLATTQNLPCAMTDKKISITWIEVLLLITILLAGLGLGAFATSLIEGEREIRRPREEAFIGSAELLARQSEASTAQAELTAVHAKTVEQRIELVKLSAKLDSLKSGHPALNAPQGPASNASLTPDVKTELTKTEADIQLAIKILNDLNARLSAVTATSVEKSRALIEAQEAAHRDFARAEKRFQLRTRGLTFLASMALSVVVLAMAGVLVLVLNAKEKFGIRLKFVLISGFAILLALTSYQAFQVAGATLTVLTVAFIASIFALRWNKEPAAVSPGNEAAVPLADKEKSSE